MSMASSAKSSCLINLLRLTPKATSIINAEPCKTAAGTNTGQVKFLIGQMDLIMPMMTAMRTGST